MNRANHVNQIQKRGLIGPTGVEGRFYFEPDDEDDGSLSWRLDRISADLAKFVNEKLDAYDTVDPCVAALDEILWIATMRKDLELLDVLRRFLLK